jgi:hypothetical protein
LHKVSATVSFGQFLVKRAICVSIFFSRFQVDFRQNEFVFSFNTATQSQVLICQNDVTYIYVAVTHIRFILDVGCGDGCSHPQPHPHPFIQNIQNISGCHNDFEIIYDTYKVV